MLVRKPHEISIWFSKSAVWILCDAITAGSHVMSPRVHKARYYQATVVFVVSIKTCRTSSQWFPTVHSEAVTCISHIFTFSFYSCFKLFLACAKSAINKTSTVQKSRINSYFMTFFLENAWGNLLKCANIHGNTVNKAKKKLKYDWKLVLCIALVLDAS